MLLETGRGFGLLCRELAESFQTWAAGLIEPPTAGPNLDLKLGEDARGGHRSIAGGTAQLFDAAVGVDVSHVLLQSLVRRTGGRTNGRTVARPLDRMALSKRA